MQFFAWTDTLGYIAAGAVFVSFSMKNMQALRIVALVSNVAFISYALVDGLTRFEVFRKVVLPMVRGGLFATAVFTFVFAWNEFIFALVLTRNEVTTFPVQVTHYFGGQSNLWAKIAAMSMLGTLPIFVVVAFLQRFLVRGISLGAVKG